MKTAKCPNKNCDGKDSMYLTDDCTYHECDECYTTWKTYDPENKISECKNINIPTKIFGLLIRNGKNGVAIIDKKSKKKVFFNRKENIFYRD